MKNLFNATRYRAIAADLAQHTGNFDAKRFLKLCLDGLEQRELMDRMRQTAIAFESSLSGSFQSKVKVLRAHAPSVGHNFAGIWPCEFVALFGLDDPEFSLTALRDLTQYGSAEFAVRPFIVREQTATLAIMRRWAGDANEHVRRLASEGSRPRLPWGQRLNSLVVDPAPTASILEALKSDPSLYVRKSVANHLNDITKDHPEYALDIVESWDRANPHTSWIIRHGIRTLIKQGHPRALALVGAGATPKLDISDFNALPKRLELGDTLTLCATLTNPTRRAQNLVIDYVMHYARNGGKTSAKVFKWTAQELAPGAAITLTKRQVIRDFSTRKHYAGPHRVELQINGQRFAESEFVVFTNLS